LAGIIDCGTKKTENMASAAWSGSADMLAIRAAGLHLKERCVHTGTPELVGNDGSGSGRQKTVDAEEEGRDEGLFEDAVASEDEVGSGLRGRSMSG
jgi:hypothetical protein